MNQRPIAIDLFAGCGGMSLGLEASGFDVAIAIEFDAVHSLVHHFNFPDCHTICRDITQVTSTEILAILKAKGYPMEVDLIAGGPPCQGFSLMGKRQLDDPRNALVFQYVRLVAEIQPKYFIFENVPGMATGKHRLFLEELINQFETVGYRITHPVQILDASEYGAPQKRKRLILLGSRSDQKLAQYPDKKVNFDPQKLDNSSVKTSSTQTTVFEAISDLEAIPAMTGTDRGVPAKSLSYINHRQKYAMAPSDAFQFCHHRFHRGIVYGHLGSLHTPDSRARFAITKPGTIEPKSRFWKLSADGFCNTLRAGTNRDKGAYTAPRPIHYALPRCITIREAARLHTFPDWFQFHRTIWHGFREIGNAVIPVLAKELGSSILKSLEIDPQKLPRLKLNSIEETILAYNLAQASAYWEINDNVIPKRKRRARH